MPEYFDNRGLSYAANGDYDRAIADYNEAIRITPQANFLTNRGDAYNQKGDYDRAIDDYDRALKLNPGFTSPTTTAAQRTAARATSTGPSRTTSRRCASIRSSTRRPRISPPSARSATAAAFCPIAGRRRSIAAPPSARWRRRSAPTRTCRRLDRQIDDAYKAAQSQRDRKTLGTLHAEQREFVSTRNKSFGRPEYNLKREMEKRLYALRGLTAAN